MQRPIKFRAWANDYMHEDITMVTDSTYNGIVPHEGTELMQYTGLKDKNGVEIYEGDILGDSGDARPVIIFEKGSFGYRFYQMFFDIRSIETMEPFEVIGNIYENGDLIK